MVKNRLEEIRMKEFMMTRVAFAEKLGINYKQYVKYEKDVVPSMEVAFKIAKKLNRKVDNIFYLED